MNGLSRREIFPKGGARIVGRENCDHLKITDRESWTTENKVIHRAESIRRRRVWDKKDRAIILAVVTVVAIVTRGNKENECFPLLQKMIFQN
jgi:hypothetical protein